MYTPGLFTHVFHMGYFSGELRSPVLGDLGLSHVNNNKALYYNRGLKSPGILCLVFKGTAIFFFSMFLCKIIDNTIFFLVGMYFFKYIHFKNTELNRLTLNKLILKAFT